MVKLNHMNGCSFLMPLLPEQGDVAFCRIICFVDVASSMLLLVCFNFLSLQQGNLYSVMLVWNYKPFAKHCCA